MVNEDEFKAYRRTIYALDNHFYPKGRASDIEKGKNFKWADVAVTDKGRWFTVEKDDGVWGYFMSYILFNNNSDAKVKAAFKTHIKFLKTLLPTDIRKTQYAWWDAKTKVLNDNIVGTGVSVPFINVVTDSSISTNKEQQEQLAKFEKFLSDSTVASSTIAGHFRKLPHNFKKASTEYMRAVFPKLAIDHKKSDMDNVTNVIADKAVLAATSTQAGRVLMDSVRRKYKRDKSLHIYVDTTKEIIRITKTRFV